MLTRSRFVSRSPLDFSRFIPLTSAHLLYFRGVPTETAFIFKFFPVTQDDDIIFFSHKWLDRYVVRFSLQFEWLHP